MRLRPGLPTVVVLRGERVPAVDAQVALGAPGLSQPAEGVAEAGALAGPEAVAPRLALRGMLALESHAG